MTGLAAERGGADPLKGWSRAGGLLVYLAFCSVNHFFLFLLGTECL